MPGVRKMATNRKHILVVEDEQHLAIGIKYNLEAESYRVTTASDGPTALKIIEQSGTDLHMVILDVMLPGMSGYEICESLRASGSDLPVLILSARTLSEDRARGFDVGADQYMIKPFDLNELLSRVNNLLSLHDRRKAARSSMADDMKTYEFAGAKINFDTFEVTVNGETARLTALNLRLLKYFIQHEGRVIPRPELLENVWQQPGNIATRAPDQFIRRLRETFEPDPANPVHFLTIRDAGYRFVASPGDEPNA